MDLLVLVLVPCLQSSFARFPKKILWNSLELQQNKLCHLQNKGGLSASSSPVDPARYDSRFFLWGVYLSLVIM
jgi:hypothetical protein